MATKKNIFTKEGFEKLRLELDRLKNVVRLEIANKLNEAAEYGDLSENAAYQVAIDQRDTNEAMIAEIEETLANAKIMKASAKKDGVVSMGSSVVIEDQTGNKVEFEIVGTGETDLLNKKFNADSPLVSATMGKKKGDKVEVLLPGGKKTFTITSVK